MTVQPENGMTRRNILQLAGMAGAGLLLASCAGPGTRPGGGSAPAAGPTPPASGTPKGEVSFAHWRGEDQAAFDELIARFQKEYADVTVVQDITASNDYSRQALQRVRNGASGDALTSFRGSQFKSFVDAEILTDLSGTKAPKSYTADLIEAGRADGKQLAIPYQTVLLMPVANVDLFDKAKADIAPADWDAFLDACDKLKSSGVTPLSWPGGDQGNAAQLVNSLVLHDAPSDDMFTQVQEGKLKVTDDWFLKVLEKYQQLAPFFQSNFTGTSYESSQQLFASGQAAMLATGSYSLATVRGLGSTFDMDMIFPNPAPKGEGKWEGVYNATFMLGVNAASKVQPAALAWVEFLSRKESAEFYANKTAQFVTVAGVEYTNPDLAKAAAFLDKKIALAPRYQFTNLDMANAVWESCVKVAAGTSPEQAAEAAQQIIDQQQGT
ncbi:ABC transporter substrate-binding protein [Microbacterium sp. 179-I 3D2 NHS]|uniref:ABC transporter substrate-binding protein n=1 Tax=Microbacterium sp. 179-I 3D2 NHS TaxID=3235178 RepID=UPI0039A39E0F